MDAKPHPDPKDYHEGEAATERFLQGVKSVLGTSPEKLRKRHAKWEKAKKQQRKNNLHK